MRLLFFTLVLSVTACIPSKPKLVIPKNLVAVDKMTEVLTEMAVLEAYLKNKYPDFGRFHAVMTNSGDSLLASNGLTPESYESSLRYYSHDRKILESIYEKVLENLASELGELQSN